MTRLDQASAGSQVLEADDAAPLKGHAATRRLPAAVKHRPRAATAVRLAAAATTGATVLLVGLAGLSDELDVSTDIIGNSTFSNFNSPNYYRTYFSYLAAVAATALVFIALGRWLPGRASSPTGPQIPEAESAPAVGAATRLALLVLTTSVLTLELAVGMSDDASTVWRATGLAASGAVGLGLGLEIGSRRRASLLPSVPLLTLALAVLTIPALAVLEAGSEIVTLDGARPLHWLPPGLIPVLTLVALAMVVLRVRRSGLGTAASTAGAYVLWIVVPVAAFLLEAAVPRELSEIDAFHLGEIVTPAHLLRGGAVPWRDITVVHGFGHDGLFGLFGLSTVDSSAWGVEAGLSLVVVPLFLAGMLLLAHRISGGNWILVGLYAALAVRRGVGVNPPSWLESFSIVFHYPMTRFVLFPVALLLLHRSISKPTRSAWVLLTVVLAVQAVLIPESAIFAAIVAAVSLLWCLTQRRAGAASPFAPLLWAGSTGVAFAVVLAVGLALAGALGNFAEFYLEFSGGHTLTGALPIDWSAPGGLLDLVTFMPPVLIALGALVLVQRHDQGSLEPIDWLAAVLVLWQAAYYTKFLGRSDAGHGLHAASMSPPLIVYLLGRVLTPLERRLRTRSSGFVGTFAPRLPTGVVAIVALATIAPPVQAWASELPGSFHRDATRAHYTEDIGYVDSALPPDRLAYRFDADVIHDVDVVVSAAGGADGEVYDFTNSPLLFHFFLDRPLATRYYNASLVIRRDSQLDAIQDLEAAMPPVVIFSSSLHGLHTWDSISNQVRHYELSDWILDHYEPYATVHGYGVWVPAGRARDLPSPSTLLTSTPVTTERMFRPGWQACGWGFSPTHFSPRPTNAAVADAVAVPHSTVGTFGASGWAVTGAVPASEIVLVADGSVIGRGTPSTARPDIAEIYGESALASGFAVSGSLPTAVTPDQVTVLGLDGSDHATLMSGPALGEAELAALGLEPSSDAVAGWVDATDGRAADGTGFELELPDGAVEMGWLRVSVAPPKRDTVLTLTDNPSNPADGITFTVAAGETDPLWVRIGACPQWRDYGDSLLLIADRAVDELELSLADD